MSSQSPQGYAQHPTMGGVAYRVDPVSSDPDMQVAQTIDLMQRYALEDLSDPYLLMDAQAAAFPDPISGVWNLVRGRMKFFDDETNGAGMPVGNGELVEVLIRPRDVARTQGCYGDCDDFSMTTAALLMANGIPCAFATIAAESEAPSRYSHVYCVAYVPMADGTKVRVPMDTSHGPHPGWESPVAYRKREWPLTSEACTGAPGGSLAWLSLGLSLFSVFQLLRKGLA